MEPTLLQKTLGFIKAGGGLGGMAVGELENLSKLAGTLGITTNQGVPFDYVGNTFGCQSGTCKQEAIASVILYGTGFIGAEMSAASRLPSFADKSKLLSHFEKHGKEFGAKSPAEYLQVGHDIMQYGSRVEYMYKGEARTGYVQFMGNKSNGQSKFGFVGTNADGAITTIHTESGNSFWKMLNGNVDKVIRPTR